VAKQLSCAFQALRITSARRGQSSANYYFTAVLVFASELSKSRPRNIYLGTRVFLSIAMTQSPEAVARESIEAIIDGRL
jgi:hypothetical protein